MSPSFPAGLHVRLSNLAWLVKHTDITYSFSSGCNLKKLNQTQRLCINIYAEISLYRPETVQRKSTLFKNHIVFEQVAKCKADSTTTFPCRVRSQFQLSNWKDHCILDGEVGSDIPNTMLAPNKWDKSKPSGPSVNVSSL